MCGIVAAVADRNIVPVLLEGLRKLEYRGYDSAGLALINDAGLQRLRTVGRVVELTAQVEGSQVAGNTGIAVSYTHLDVYKRQTWKVTAG